MTRFIEEECGVVSSSGCGVFDDCSAEQSYSDSACCE